MGGEKNTRWLRLGALVPGPGDPQRNDRIRRVLRAASYWSRPSLSRARSLQLEIDQESQQAGNVAHEQTVRLRPVANDKTAE
jgi:hypothetical protein